MKTQLFYFSTTGNCLTTARLLSSHFDNCQINSFLSMKGCTIEADVVGLIFPIYYGDMPYIVRECISSFTFKGNPYIFLFATCRGHTGAINARLNHVLSLKGQKLSYSTFIPMPGNSWISTKEENKNRLEKQEERLLEQLPNLLNQKTEDYSSLELPEDSPMIKLHNMRGIKADDSCIGCGICSKICPTNNIHIINGKATIGENCQTCLACFHWCPQEAIYMSKENEELARRFKYQHPDVCLKDIMK